MGATTGITWPRSGSSVAASTPSVIGYTSQTNLSGTHTYSSISGLQAGDIMLVVTAGPYRVKTAPSGWAMLADAGDGGAAMTVSQLAKVATSSSETVTLTFDVGNTSNFSALVVIRGATFALGRSAQLQSGPGTSPLTFPAPNIGWVGGVLSGVTMALLFVSGALGSTITYTLSPSATSTVFDLPAGGAGGRTFRLYVVPVGSSYSATPSGSDYRAGTITHIG